MTPVNALTPAVDVRIEIGGIKLRVGDLRGFMDSNVILANGMKIQASAFEINAAQAAVKARAEAIAIQSRRERRP